MNSSWRFFSRRVNGPFPDTHPLSARSRAARAAWSSGAKSLSESNASSSAGVRPTRLTKETGRFAGLFALFGFFPALFGLGLVSSLTALDRLLSKTGRDDHVIPNIIALTGYAVGHWWQGRVVEGAGLFALHAGVILVLERLRI